ncbi:MAG: division/cell wall cluster transcriptional repressor MraZ [Limisphaerales bacterium]
MLPVIFTGRHRPKVDDKRRMQVPSEWRGGRTGGIKYLFVPVARDGFDPAFIKVLPEHRLAKLYHRLDDLDEFDDEADALRRTVGADSVLVETDGAGRVCLPDEMAKGAGLNGEVLLVGAMGHFEIWPQARGDAALKADRPRALAKRRDLKV